jgi:hypothetical protein
MWEWIFRFTCLDLGTSWRWVVSFMPLPLYMRGKSSRYPLDRRLGGPQSQSGRRGEEKTLDPPGTRTTTPWSSSPYPVAIPTELSRDDGRRDKIPHIDKFFFLEMSQSFQNFAWSAQTSKEWSLLYPTRTLFKIKRLHSVPECVCVFPFILRLNNNYFSMQH